ncbi:ATP-binding protein [Metallibacterium sp.]|uniref:Dph6-related ATP pyrophosphatase n=1 Tax=Metallibacterium sp. TaxID=2940281 RepID=UPI002607174C|nr:ATP-binding protein [Metallibacterium sp.]
MSTPRPILLAWSGGKDCLMALERLRADPAWRVVGLLTTVTGAFDRVAMHGIRRGVLHAQAAALDLPLLESVLDWPASNASYTQAFAASLEQARAAWPGLAHIAFGDLFLADVRAWRVALLGDLGWQGEFPLWGADTATLARSFIAAGHQAVLTCVDTTQLDASFSGRVFDVDLLAALPAAVDPCGEHGEFHTLCHAGPLFAQALPMQRGASLLREERFQYTDFLLDGDPAA